jgi:acetylxylan esterase
MVASFRAFRGALASLALLVATMTSLPGTNAASLQAVSNFGANPSGARMFIYVPDNVTARPAVVVAVHYCSGSAQAYFSGTPYRQLSDTHGFIVIYPESPYSGGCWDVSSPATLRYEGGGSSNAIANMVRWTLERYSADADRVFVTGTSSGGMMTVTETSCSLYW